MKIKNKCLFILLIVISIGVFIPNGVFAKNVESIYNTNIDYQFFVDEDESDAGKLKFKLYDKTGSLSFDSSYDSNTKIYYFFVDENNYDDSNNFENGIRDYIPYSNELQNLNTFNDVKNFLETNKLNNKWKNAGTYFDPDRDYGNDYKDGLGNRYEFNIYTYIPMILEVFDNYDKSILKKIVFASFNIKCDYFYNTDDPYYNASNYDEYYIGISLINNTNHWNREYQYIFGSKFLENVDFMRKTVLDYSDELWEELNSGAIASSEINANNVGHSNLNYVNQRISDGKRNVSEETLEDYASSLPVLSFRKTSDNSVDEANINDNQNIVDIITNPKTWNSGTIVLLVSITVITIGGYELIRKRRV